MRNHPHFKAYLALASVCFFWGTTYIAIRIALESFPPLLLISGRFLLSGTLMMLLVLWRGLTLPRGKELLWTAMNGILILGGGNGCLVFSERLIPSSLAALFLATSPFWLVGLESLVPGGEKLRWVTLIGIVAGFSGAALLFAPNLAQHGMQGSVWQGFLLLQLGSFSWSLGSILQKRNKSTVHPIVSGGIQQFAAGVAFLLPAILENGRAVDWSVRGSSAVLYLAIFGSMIGYTSYIYALEKLPVALVSVYTYVNPLVAAVLGWIFYREPFGWREMSAMAVIFTGVALVKKFSGPARLPSLPVLPRASEAES